METKINPADCKPGEWYEGTHGGCPFGAMSRNAFGEWRGMDTAARTFNGDPQTGCSFEGGTDAEVQVFRRLT